LELLRDMAEFFQAFAPLYEGFRARALAVQALLRDARTRFLLVAGPAPERVADTLFFARKLGEAGHHLRGVIVNQVHPRAAAGSGLETEGRALFAWLGARDAQGVADLRSRLGARVPLVEVALAPREPA